MIPARRHAAEPRRDARGSDSTARSVLRTAAAAGGISAGALAGSVLGAAAIAASFARIVVTPPRGRPDDMRVLAIDHEAGTIRLTVGEDALVPGRYSLWFDGGTGHARIGRILDESDGCVTRELLGIDHGELSVGMGARLGGWFHLSPRGVDLPFSTVDVPVQFGQAPAWLFSGASTERWAIAVHGRGGSRQEALRAVPALHDAGLTTLVVSYRNDGDAPASPDGRYAMGETEWLDVDAAIRYAEANGAREVVLVGFSMGGAIVLQAATRSTRRALVTGIVLDSPVVDWVDTLRFQARLMGLAPSLGSAIIRTLQSRWSTCITRQAAVVDLAAFDFVARADELTVPILLAHSDDDGFVPSGPSHALAAARPDLVTFSRWDVATHAKLWNYDTERWDGELGAWLARLAAAAPATVAPTTAAASSARS